MPYTRWVGDLDETDEHDQGPWLGYCNHESILFPHWHRPHVMLLEQTISEAAHRIAVDLAKQHPQETEVWLRAARELRFPFWDWTLPVTAKEGLPSLLYKPTLQLHMPNNQTISYDNILACYHFDPPVQGFTDRPEYSDRMHRKPGDSQSIAYFGQWKRTYRWPSSSPSDPVEDIKSLNKGFMDLADPPVIGSWTSLTSSVSQLFNYPIDVPPELRANVWDEFSNTTFQSAQLDKKGKTSSPYVWICGTLEQPHNEIHLVIGGIGHMSDNDTSAFDPIFYLRHCNVDRLLAFWEHIYPDYVPGDDGYLDADGKTRRQFTQSGGSWVETPDQVVNGSTDLVPFRMDDGGYWSSKTAHSLTADSKPKYYTYPPICGVVLGQELSSQQRNDQRGVLQRYFGFNPLSDRESAPFVQHRFFSGISTTCPPRGLEPVHNYRHFVISASLSPHAFNGSYFLKIFLTTPRGETHVGSIPVLRRGESRSCGNCQRRKAAGAWVRGTLVVSHSAVVALLEHHNLNNETAREEDLVQAFRKSLRARVVLPSGTVYAEMFEGSARSMEMAISEDATPYIRLHSSNVAIRRGEDDMKDLDAGRSAPHELYDWKDHGLLVAGHWIMCESAHS
ncbi:Di-copper centre-containing protein [Ceratobasidium sp. AG-I]|nr:Di-copper centre-containing protein [Ceratobasidium sp. AG-I]